MNFIPRNIGWRDEPHFGRLVAGPCGAAKEATDKTDGEFLAYFAVIVCGDVPWVGIDSNQAGDIAVDPGFLFDLAPGCLADGFTWLHPTAGDRPVLVVGRQCGVNVYPHRFRHHFSHTWLDRGGAERDLMELNGWTSPQMLTRYGASDRGARARRSYDRIMDDT